MANLPDKNKLLYNFNRCINWEQKYLYLIELGEKLSRSFNEEFRKPEYVIFGCQSQVWIHMTYKADGTITFEGDSDAAIVKGLIAVIFSFYEGLTVQEIIKLKIQESLQKLELTKHLTPLRSQGLEAMIYTIQRNARAFL
ncbi:cysteine desulfuration protein SufE [Candidatus Pantoea carbekii]|uniref:SufE protein n=1 Tax=Candidatus Pantoea carbekii TaxID=1235990 RepID=U3U831_9GAMM|nr:cysteine desulfuration protein SufE [Candidatus Pantoea carbekii]AKC32096.1 cysteine desulfuration protein SufE [Candidatus Pantoea carbekii]BAO00622.1 SufE protein [Candidatus Pantoea carbekii]